MSSKQVHVKLDGKNGHYSHNTKIIPWNNDISQSIAQQLSMSYTSGRRIISSTSGSLSQQDNSTLHYRQFSSRSVKNQPKLCELTKTNSCKTNKDPNQSQRKNIICKNGCIVLSVCLLGIIVIAALILPNVVLYLMIPSIFRVPLNQTNSTEPPTYAQHCSGVSPYTNWFYYSATGIYMPMNTSHCNFNSTPLYYTSIVGINLQHDLTGTRAIYAATRNKFTIFWRSYNGWSGTQLLDYSQVQQWNVNCVGIYY